MFLFSDCATRNIWVDFRKSLLRSFRRKPIIGQRLSLWDYGIEDAWFSIIYFVVTVLSCLSL